MSNTKFFMLLALVLPIASRPMVPDTSTNADDMPIDTYPIEEGSLVDEKSATLENFCKFFLIAPSNCTCERSPLVCEVTDFGQELRHNDSVTFTRHNKVTFMYATIALVSSIFGMVGNAAVICIAYRQRSQLSPCKLHIAELAVVNLVFSLVQVGTIF